MCPSFGISKCNLKKSFMHLPHSHDNCCDTFLSFDEEKVMAAFFVLFLLSTAVRRIRQDIFYDIVIGP